MKPFRIILLLCCLIACKEKKAPSEEQAHLDLYLHETQQLRLNAYDHLFVVVISGRCGSCTEKTIRFINALDKDGTYKTYQKIVIIPDNNAEVVDSFRQSSARFIVDKGHVLEKYGVNFPKNMFMEFRKDELVFKDWLYMERVDSVALRYGMNIQ